MNMNMKLQDWVLPFGCLLAMVAGGPCLGQAQAPAAQPAREGAAGALSPRNQTVISALTIGAATVPPCPFRATEMS